jgi:hypothetical protein
MIPVIRMMEFGVQLGCNGIVHILFEYIDENSLKIQSPF